MNRWQRRAMGGLSQAEYQRIADTLERDGCSRCHVRFGGGVPYLIGRLPSGKWRGRCMNPECSAAFLHTAPVFIGTTLTAVDPWMEDDRDWFRDHPNRSWRLRYPLPGELPTLLTDTRFAGHTVSERQCLAHVAVAVYQFVRGKRMRIPICYAGNDDPASFTDAGIVSLAPPLLDILQRSHAVGPSDADLRDAISERLQRRVEAWAPLMRKESVT